MRFYDAHMDLISVHPVFNLYNMEWPILTLPDPLPPAKFVFADDGHTGHALDSMVCPGVIISGAEVSRSVISPNVHVDSYALVEGSVVFSGVRVGQRAIVRNAIVDKDVVIEPGARRHRPRDRPRALHRLAGGDRRHPQGRTGRRRELTRPGARGAGRAIGPGAGGVRPDNRRGL